MGEVAEIEPRLTKAMSHPMRIEILRKLQGGAASSAELSRQLEARPKVIAYHAKVLVQYGCLELIHTTPRGGTVVDSYFGLPG
jgi:DNA-binding transcriptional ArsR family regulator